jgi:adenosylcobinamide-GDP ribazoletransferase
VVALIVVLLVQVAALAQLVVDGAGGSGLVAALVVSRLALPLACLRRVPSARPDGLGATVAGSVSWPMAGVAVALAVLGTAVGVVAGQPLDHAALVDAAWAVVPAALGLLAGGVVVAHAVRRLGGITGDVLGAAVETTLAAALVTLCIL